MDAIYSSPINVFQHANGTVIIIYDGSIYDGNTVVMFMVCVDIATQNGFMQIADCSDSYVNLIVSCKLANKRNYTCKSMSHDFSFKHVLLHCSFLQPSSWNSVLGTLYP